MPQSEPFADDETAVEEYLKVLVRGWWLILATLVMALIVAGATSPSQPPDIYEAHTNVAIPRYISNSGILNQGGSVPLGLNAVDAISDATLERVIQATNLQNAETGAPWSVKQLAELTSVSPQDSGSPQQLTLTVRGQDSALTKRILDAWVDIFLLESSQILQSEVSRSRQFTLSQYENTGQELAAKEEERLSYLRQNPLLALEGSLKVSQSQLQDLVNQLSVAQSALVEVEPKLDGIRNALSVDIRFIDLDQRIEDESLLLILAEEIDRLEPQPYPDLIPTTEVPNDVLLFFRFRQLEALLEAKKATLTASISFLESEVSRLKSDIESQSFRIDAMQLDIRRFDRDIGMFEEDISRMVEERRTSNLDLPELSGPLVEADPVSEPRVSISSNNPLIQRMTIGAVMGLLLGTISTFAVDYIRRLRKKRPAG